MTAKNLFSSNLLRYLCLHFNLLKARAKRCVLGFKIGALSLKCRILRLNEPDSLLEDRRRAMLVDKFLQKIKHRPFVPRSRADVR